MNNYLDLLKTLYTKQKLCYNVEIGECIALTKTLSKDINNLEAIKKCLPFLFYLAPNHYFYMLYFNIPRRDYVPKMLKLEIEEVEEDKLYDKIQYVLGLSNREMKFNKQILDKTIDREKMKMELAVK